MICFSRPTLLWLPDPESLRIFPCSYGVVIWEMLSGDIPHYGLQPSAMIVKSISGELGNLPVKQSFPEDYKLLIKSKFKTCVIIQDSVFFTFISSDKSNQFPFNG